MKHNTIIVTVGLALAIALPSAHSNAQGARSFVSPTGSDSNNCSLAAPCRFLQAALAQTNPGGEIAILGTAGYNNGATVTINKAISIVNPGAFEAGIIVPSGGAGIVINAGANDVVSLRGLTIEGVGVGNTGIEFDAGASLNVENCFIRYLTALGVYFRPNVSSDLSISNSLVANNGNNGISVFPSGSAAVTAVFNRVEVKNNSSAGIYVDGLNSTGAISATVSDSIAARNGGIGFFAETALGHAPTTLMLFHSVAANNGFGLFANGPGATIRVFQSMVTGNGEGWVANGSGVVQSSGNNSIDGNQSAEAAPPSIAQK